MNTLQLPTKLVTIPTSYFRPNQDHPGQLVNLYYDTYESFSYHNYAQGLRKRAVVYLPAGYSRQKQYNVFYLMHGGWSDETTYLGTPDNPHPFKFVLDNAIASGVIQPLIVVCPTYNNLSHQDSGNYSLALRLTANYHHELVNDLLPAVATQFSTFAPDATPAGLQTSRNHRAFCGFSMGSVTTWHVFQSALKDFRYFFPSSGSLTNDGSQMAKYVRQQGMSPADFFIFAASGAHDFAYPAMTEQMQAMVKHGGEIFHYSHNEQDGNLYYLVSPNGTHGPKNAIEDFYNALIQLWKEG